MTPRPLLAALMILALPAAGGGFQPDGRQVRDYDVAGVGAVHGETGRIDKLDASRLTVKATGAGIEAVALGEASRTKSHAAARKACTDRGEGWDLPATEDQIWIALGLVELERMPADTDLIGLDRPGLAYKFVWFLPSGGYADMMRALNMGWLELYQVKDGTPANAKLDKENVAPAELKPGTGNVFQSERPAAEPVVCARGSFAPAAAK